MFVSITNCVLLSLIFVWCSLSSSFYGGVDAACENLCSGHGICLSDDVCQCYDGWGLGVNELSGDCSERFCPFDVAWVDTPDSFGNFHKYLECSGRGICDRTLGECVCFDGYSGSGCYRTSCPNDCSGHGNCEFIEDVPFAGTYNEYSVGYAGDAWLGGRGLKEMEKQIRFEYPQWDKQKSMECVCDPHYGDLDCSKRMCPFGTDVLDVSDNLLVEQGVHTQTIQFVITNRVFDGGDGVASDSSYNAGKSFSLLFKSQLNETFQTIPIVFDNAVGGHAADMARDIQVALLTLPNRVIDGVKVTCEWDFTNALYFDKLLCVVKFTGSSVQGKQHLLSVGELYIYVYFCICLFALFSSLLYFLFRIFFIVIFYHHTCVRHAFSTIVLSLF
jgi:hypothetical protein